MKMFVSTAAAAWQEALPSVSAARASAKVGGVITPNFLGFGVCFNGLGWKALAGLDQGGRQEVLNSLFAPDELALSYCRLPIGANDYSDEWYSLAEVDQDFDLAHFTIARDEATIIPYIKAAQSAAGRPLTLFASPWSPPTWLKTQKAFNYGVLRWEDRYLRTYAQYFVRFVRAYAENGIEIDAVHVQNEPDSDQKFPSCVWTGEKLAAFIRDYLAPAFRQAQLDTKIWLGTIERPSFNEWVAPTLLDPEARAAISGVGFQWAGKGAAQRTRQAAPDLPIIQTENECGDGHNSWDYAHYVFDLIQHFLSNGASAYVYWNAVLEEGGISTWGWRQNSLFTVNAEQASATRRPEYYVLKHFARFVRPGAQVLSAKGGLGANAVFFRNEDGSETAVLQNPLTRPLTVEVEVQGRSVAIDLPPKSFATLAQ